MTTSKLPWLLALNLFSASSYSSEPIPWDTVLSQNQRSLDLSGYFQISDTHFHYLGFKFDEESSLDAEFEFLLALQDRVSELLGNLCEQSQSSLPESHQFNFPFTKNVVEQAQGVAFVASVSKQVLRQEAKRACVK